MKKSKGKATQNITIGDIKNTSGRINIAGSNITITETKTQEQLFAPIFMAIDAREATPAEKKDLKADVQEVEEALKKPKVDESFVSRRLRNIGRMAPDILDVILATITSPAAGLGLVGKKIAEKVKEK